MTEKCENCKADYDTPLFVRPAVKALGLEGFCGECIGFGLKWAIRQSKKK